MKYLNTSLNKWQAQVNNKKNDMLYYMIFLRVTPIVPNWFINLASPLIDIPAVPFALGTFIGTYILCNQLFLSRFVNSFEFFSRRRTTFLCLHSSRHHIEQTYKRNCRIFVAVYILTRTFCWLIIASCPIQELLEKKNGIK